jgi:hypothetical protein
VSRKKAYVLAFLYAQYVPIIDALSAVYIGGRVIPYDNLMYILLKVNIFIEVILYVFFIVQVIEKEWYRCYWWAIVVLFALSPTTAIYFNNFMHTDLVKGTMFTRVTWNTLPLYLLGLVVIVLVGIGFVFIGRMIGKLKKIDRIHKLSFYIIYLCFGIMILFSEKDYFVEDNVMKAYTNYKLTLLMMVGIMIIILISINQMDKRVLRIENNLLKKQNELQYANYIGMQQYELELHKLYHDIGNHIKTIQILVDQGNKQEAKNYTEDLINQYRVIAKDYYCSNKILNAVLLNKVKICEENNITTQIDLQIPENITVRDIDLMCIFSNLLDNAIEGCRRNLNACNYIHIKTVVMNNFYTIFVINSKDMTPSIIDDKGRYATTKQDKKLHGYGLRILDEIIERYKGQKEFIDRGDEFTAMIMLML